MYTGAGPRLPGMMNRLGLRRVHRLGGMVRPGQLWMKLCGHSSCFNTLMICWRKSRNLEKSRRGATMGGLQRNPATLLKEKMLSIAMDDVCTLWGE